MIRYALTMMLLLLTASLWAADDERKVPLKYVSPYYPPTDRLAVETPRLLMSRPVRLRLERERFLSFLKRYNLQDQVFAPAKKPDAKKNDRSGMKKKARKPKPKRWVWGFYFDKERPVPLINVNGRFLSIKRLFPGQHAKVLKVREDRLFVSANGRVYKIEVGKPLPF